MWAKSVRSIALAAYKCWSNLHQNGGKIVKLVKMSTDQVKITRRQHLLSQKEVTVCPVGIQRDGLPQTVLDTFAYSSSLLCNDEALAMTKKMATSFDEFKKKLFNVDLCRLAFVKGHVCDTLL